MVTIVPSRRSVIVTGGGSGIGAACCAVIAEHGYEVVVADVNDEAATDVASRICSDGGQAYPLHVDLARPDSVAELIERAASHPYPIAGLVNNAGISIAKPLEQLTVADWDIQLQVNLRGAFLALQAVVPHFKKEGYGKVVNIASTAAFVSSSTPELAYDVSKAGLRQLTISASVELAPYGINVNAVAPGTIATALTTAVLNTPEKLWAAGAKIPAGRLGTPVDIANAVAFLLSREADYIHGHTLVVDGGWLAL